MKPILFSTPMVLALLNTKPGTWPAEPIDPSKPCKSQTRRVMKPQPMLGEFRYDGIFEGEHYLERLGDSGNPTEHYYNIGEARYKKGDILWVRETWLQPHIDAKQILLGRLPIQYKADFTEEELAKIAKAYNWKPSTFMPREAARIFLEVKDVRAERVQDISEADTIAEGIKSCFLHKEHGGEWKLSNSAPFEGVGIESSHFTRKSAFHEIWDSINAKSGPSWNSNPWVWVYEFGRVEDAC